MFRSLRVGAFTRFQPKPQIIRGLLYRDAFFTVFKLFGYGVDESTPETHQITSLGSRG